MVDSSDYVIALYNSDDWVNSYTGNGTAECMRYAESVNKDIWQFKYQVDTNGKLFISEIKIIK